jgi:hypothetical protein
MQKSMTEFDPEFLSPEKFFARYHDFLSMFDTINSRRRFGDSCGYCAHYMAQTNLRHIENFSASYNLMFINSKQNSQKMEP